MNRISLVTCKRSAFTPDTVEALRLLEIAAKEFGGVRLAYGGRPIIFDPPRGSWGSTQLPEYMSMWPTGREVDIRLIGTDRRLMPAEEVAILWGLAVPLGFTPWNRYPITNSSDQVFHFLGPWQRLYDHLCGEGRGELALPSVACAAQVDAGVWRGDRQIERFVQAQLHRIGFPCGPVDGIIGERTLTALRSAGLQGSTLEAAQMALSSQLEPSTEDQDRTFSYIIAPGHDIQVHSFGKVASMKTPSGASFAIDGPGRVVIDFP